MFFIFWMQGFWIPIPLIVIIIYAITALIARLIIRKPFNTKILGLWTSFLLITFSMLILQVEVLQPNLFWISMVPIGVTLVVATIGTILISSQKNS